MAIASAAGWSVSVWPLPALIDLEVASAWRGSPVPGGCPTGGLISARADLAAAAPGASPSRAADEPNLESARQPHPYDAAYVALAELLDTVLLTADSRLARASGIQCEVELLTVE